MLEAAGSRMARPITHFMKTLALALQRHCPTTTAAAVAFELSSLLANLILTPTDLG